MLGDLLRLSKDLLKKQGIILSSGFVVTMPTNYIIWGGADSEEKQKDYFAKEQKRIDAILPLIKENSTVRKKQTYRSTFNCANLSDIYPLLPQDG